MVPKIEISRIFKMDGTGPTKAFVDLVIADAIIIKGVRVVEGKDCLFASMPIETGKDGKWYHTVVPMSREVKEEIDRIVIEAYKESTT